MIQTLSFIMMTEPMYLTAKNMQLMDYKKMLPATRDRLQLTLQSKVQSSQQQKLQHKIIMDFILLTQQQVRIMKQPVAVMTCLV